MRRLAAFAAAVLLASSLPALATEGYKVRVPLPGLT
jgi:hypothetical protein